MSIAKRWAVLLSLLAWIATHTVSGQIAYSNVFWEYPEILVQSPARYLKVASRDDNVAILWQESEPIGDNRGEVYLSLKYRSATEDWGDYYRFAGPYRFVGREAPIYSIVVDEKGTIFADVFRT